VAVPFVVPESIFSSTGYNGGPKDVEGNEC